MVEVLDLNRYIKVQGNCTKFQGGGNRELVATRVDSVYRQYLEGGLQLMLEWIDWNPVCGATG